MDAACFCVDCSVIAAQSLDLFRNPKGLLVLNLNVRVEPIRPVLVAELR